MNVTRILLPLDLEWPAMSAVHETALLARHFHAEVVILYAVRPATFLGIELGSVHSLMEHAHEAEEKLNASIIGELAGITVKRIMVKGDPGRAILETAAAEKSDLIVIGRHERAGFSGKLLGSVTHSVLNAAEIPIWSVSESEKPAASLSLGRILCGVDFTPHDHKVVMAAADVAQQFNSKLTLAHVTPGVEIYGPGGFHEIPDLKKALVKISEQHLNQLLKDTGVKADLYTGSGEVSKVLDHAAREANVDLVVIGRRPAVGMLGGHAYKIIAQAHVPVLSV